MALAVTDSLPQNMYLYLYHFPPSYFELKTKLDLKKTFSNGIIKYVINIFACRSVYFLVRFHSEFLARESNEKFWKFVEFSRNIHTKSSDLGK